MSGAAEADPPQGTAASKHADQRNLSSATPGSHPITTEPQLEPSRLSEPASLKHNSVSRKDRQDPSLAVARRPRESGQGTFSLVRTLVDHAPDTTLPSRPPPDTQASPDAREGTPGSRAAPEHSMASDTPPPAGGMISPQLDAPAERSLRGPLVATHEPPTTPTIRVEIGRVEVRAVAPPPPMPPTRRTVPARPSPTLSLDDYLKQRNEGRL
jgi:hypothetical protein